MALAFDMHVVIIYQKQRPQTFQQQIATSHKQILQQLATCGGEKNGERELVMVISMPKKQNDNHTNKLSKN